MLGPQSAAPARPMTGRAGCWEARAPRIRWYWRPPAASWMRETPSLRRSSGSSRRCRTRRAEIPDRSVKAGVEARLRLPAQGLLDLSRVDYRAALLPGQGRAVLLGLVASGQSLQRLEDGVDIGLDPGAHVE